MVPRDPPNLEWSLNVLVSKDNPGMIPRLALRILRDLEWSLNVLVSKDTLGMLPRLALGIFRTWSGVSMY